MKLILIQKSFCIQRFVFYREYKLIIKSKKYFICSYKLDFHLIKYFKI